MLRSAVAGEDIELIDQPRRPLALVAGDWIVLASDGIHTLEPDEIARFVMGYAETGPAEVAAALIREVDARREPYQDNATVLVVEVVA
jgi:protein phosphatase